NMYSSRKWWLGLSLSALALGAVPVLWYYFGSPAVTPATVTSKTSPWFEQLALAAAIGFIKPVYTLVALGLIIFLRHVKSRDGLALLWGLGFFLVGESACAINIVGFNQNSNWLEFIHGYGMVLNFAFVAFAIIEAVDSRLIDYSDPQKKCALQGICQHCIKSGRGACTLQRGFYFLIPVLILLAFIPLMSSFNLTSYTTQILRWTYNFGRPVIFQIFDFHYVPICGIVFLSLAFVALLVKKDSKISSLKVLLAAGIGALAFSYLRLIFFDAYHDNLVWSEFWEELTELIYVSGVAYFVWIFRTKTD
ncbi:MAG TPA: hypothetical protein VF318_04320, partial [Dehalococcoidales bacterium]